LYQRINIESVEVNRFPTSLMARKSDGFKKSWLGRRERVFWCLLRLQNADIFLENINDFSYEVGKS
jgi:hypothetical protein